MLPDGDRIEGNVGNDAEQVSIGSNIKTDKTTVNVYSLPESPVPLSLGGGRLPTEVEKEFRATFAQIGERLTQNSVALAKLEATIDKNNVLTQTQIDTLKSNQRALEELARDTDEKIVKTLAGLHIVSAPAESQQPSTWKADMRLVFDALTAAGALGLLAYFITGGG
jgi:hypothetical protein